MHVSDLNHPNSELQKKLEYIYALRTGNKVNWDNEAYLRLLKKLGNPHKNLPPVIHVAGTNGKGSVVAMLRSVFEVAEYRVHAYTSPHLIRVNERIVLAGHEIENDQLLSVLDEVLGACEGASLSFFEIITTAAFLMFSRVPADVLLLEVGMGGKLDCTNVISKPLVSIVNRISMDHTEFLGSTLAEIAAQKAGIIKENVPCVVGYQGDNEQADIVFDVLKSYAKKMNASFFCCDKEWRITKENDSFVFDMEGRKQYFPRPSLLGDHQIYNAGLVIAAFSLLQEKFKIDDHHIRLGLSQVKWAGRLQRISEQTFGENGNSAEFWLDCGHNDSAGEVLAQQALMWQELDHKKLILVVAMLAKKDFLSFITPLLPYCSVIYCIGLKQEPSALDPQFAEKQIISLNLDIPVYVRKDIRDAIEHILFEQKEGVRVLIAGSVYLAGEVLQSI